MVTFLLINKKREISAIALLVSLNGVKYKRSTGESIPVKMWNPIKKRAKVTANFLSGKDINYELDKVESAALKTVSHFKTQINIPSREAFFSVFDMHYFEDKLHDNRYDFFTVFEKLIVSKKLSEGRIRHYKVLYRALKRYELFTKTNLSFENISPNTLRDFERFLKNENTFIAVNEKREIVCSPKYANVYALMPETRIPKVRGDNTISATFNLLRALFNYALKEGVTTNSPFSKFEITAENYGTPYYITIEERNQIYMYDLTQKPHLEIQRDIFVFQCLIGCRVGDLYNMTRSNVINGAIEYIANKTKDDRLITVRVPLNSIAKEILNKYKTYDCESLFPFIAKQNYNESIKKIFTLAGVTRMVTLVNTISGEQEQRPINELASSHMARRCFVGNLYKHVKDPNLIGALSGHKEGSRAFFRYREIGEETKQDLVQLLEGTCSTMGSTKKS